METLSRKCQIDAFNGIMNILRTDAKCITKMFCGTGKSRVIREVVLNQKKDISIIVFPSLALIRQYTNDYLQTIQSQKSHKILNISSEILDDFTSTTDPSEIKKFLKLKKQKIICITYQSLETLVSNLGNTVIGLACFDEAHRTISDGVRELIYNSDKYEKQVFFTATPINQNGITMFERDDVKVGDCGKLASEYTYLQGLRDGILSLFELRVDLYTEDTIEHMYESIARAILASGNQRVLTFHADTSESSSSDTSVLRFVDEKLFRKVYRNVCEKEFPEKIGKIKKITFIPITAETKNKDEILEKFDKCGDNEIYIVSSCRTIGEGVDTKKANMCVFVDPKSSINAIIQNIGRICRKVCQDEKPATVLIPVCINIDKYRECGEDYEKMDEVLREQLNDSKNGDFNAIMNVCAALKQEDPELFELCLKYPSQFTDSERMHSLNSQGCDLGDEIDYCDIDEMIENGEPVEIYTSSIEEPIISHNMEDSDDSDECEDVKRFYMISGDDDDDEEPTYYEIISKDGEKREKLNKNYNLALASNKKRPYLYILRNDEIKLLWRISSSEINKKFGSAIIDCRIEKLNNNERWKLRCKEICEFIDKNNKAPSQKSKILIERKLGEWILVMKRIYDSRGPEFSKNCMKKQEFWNIWNKLLCNDNYSKALANLSQKWKNNHEKLCLYIDKNNKLPSINSNNIEESNLRKWIGTQNEKYDSRGPEYSKNCMKTNHNIWKTWNETISNEKYYEVFANQNDSWMINFNKLHLYINKNNKLPSAHSKNLDEKKLAKWIGTQKEKYDPRGPEYSKNCMKTNHKIWKKWRDILTNPNYIELFLDFIQKWKNNYNKMCEFIDINRRRPSPNSKFLKDLNEKIIGYWMFNQIKNYDIRGIKYSKQLMKKQEIWDIWNQLINISKYKNFFNKSSKIDSQKDSIESEEPSEVSESEDPPSPSSPPKKKIVMKTHKYTPPSQSESTAPKKAVVDSDYKLISRAWSIQNSKTTHQKLLEDPTEWYNYHDARDISFQGYTDQSQIPRNRVISYLEKKRKHRIPKILDLGCGRNNIEHHFTYINPNPKFTIIGYDHVAEQGVNSRVGNISDLSEKEPDETADICIYSQSLMGSDKIDYLDEGYRILRYNGEFVIADHIDIFDDVKEKLVGLGCNIVREENDSNESKWFLLIAQKV
jgi:superfamily II DNA or RNA helicase